MNHVSRFALILLALLVFLPSVKADVAILNPTPIFDGNDGLNPPIKMQSIRGTIRQFSTTGLPLSAGTVRDVLEFWTTGGPTAAMPTGTFRSVTINRWEFATQADAQIWPKVAHIWGTVKFPGWQTMPDVGDLTCWGGDHLVVFVKGKSLVRLYVNSKNVGREYTLAVAGRVADNL